MDKHNFQKLTPINNTDLSIYDEAITFALKDNDIKNVAITGSYGAGKSSVIETYKIKHKEKKFLHISLAHFKEKGDKPTLSEEVLEGKILNQLIQQIDPDKIPQSKFKSKKQITKSSLFKYTFFLVMLGISLLYIIGYDNLKAFKNIVTQNWVKSFLNIITYEILPILFFVILIVISFYFIFLLIKKIICKNFFKRLKIQNYEFEVFNENEESYFDKNLNEVIYLFRNANADVIVYEDFDRFDSNKIFEKLRELNYLINKDNNKIIKFFYLQRDDIFSSKDRTKFLIS